MDPMSILFPVLSVGGMGVVFGACCLISLKLSATCLWCRSSSGKISFPRRPAMCFL